MGNGLCLATVIDSTRESCMLRANFATSWPGDVRAIIHSRAPLATIVYSIDTADLDFGTSRVRESTQLERRPGGGGGLCWCGQRASLGRDARREVVQPRARLCRVEGIVFSIIQPHCEYQYLHDGENEN